jgi:hypothetical protein
MVLDMSLARLGWKFLHSPGARGICFPLRFDSEVQRMWGSRNLVRRRDRQQLDGVRLRGQGSGSEERWRLGLKAQPA